MSKISKFPVLVPLTVFYFTATRFLHHTKVNPDLKKTLMSNEHAIMLYLISLLNKEKDKVLIVINGKEKNISFLHTFITEKLGGKRNLYKTKQIGFDTAAEG